MFARRYFAERYFQPGYYPAGLAVSGPYRAVAQDLFAAGATKSQIKGVGAVARQVKAAGVGSVAEVI